MKKKIQPHVYPTYGEFYELTKNPSAPFKLVKIRLQPRGYPTYEEAWNSGHDPVIPLEAFVWDYKHRLPVRDWVIRYFALSFDLFIKKYLQYSDRKHGYLEVILGFELGKNSWLAKSMRNHRLAIALEEVFMLHSFDVKIDSAIEAVIANLQKRTGSRRKPIQPSYLRKKYFSIKKTNPRHFEDVLRDISKWGLKKRENFLRQYPLLNAGFKVT